MNAHTPVSIRSTATSRLNRQLALGGILGPGLFNLAWIVLGIFQPATQNMYGVMGGISGAISNPISGLGVGPQASLFNAAFVVCGVLTFAGVIGIFGSIGVNGRPVAFSINAILLALSPVGLAMAGIYPLSVSIGLHTVGALLLFIIPVIGFLTLGLFFRRLPELRRLGTWLVIASPVTLLLFIGYAATFNQANVAAGLGIAGLTERIMMLEIHAVYVVLGWVAFRRA